MANKSILAAFERMWSYIVVALNGKCDATHNHDDDYYTKDYIDSALSNNSDANHNHDDMYYTESEIDAKLDAKADASAVPTALSDLADDESHRLVTDAEKDLWNISPIQIVTWEADD